MVSKKKNPLFESLPRRHRLSSLGRLVKSVTDSRDGVFYPSLTHDEFLFKHITLPLRVQGSGSQDLGAEIRPHS